MIDETLPTNKETLKTYAWILAGVIGCYLVGWKIALGIIALVFSSAYLFLILLCKHIEWEGRTYKDLE